MILYPTRIWLRRGGHPKPDVNFAIEVGPARLDDPDGDMVLMTIYYQMLHLDIWLCRNQATAMQVYTGNAMLRYDEAAAAIESELPAQEAA
jgi:hypothetical protein